MPQQITLDQKRLEILRRQLQGKKHAEGQAVPRQVPLTLPQITASNPPSITTLPDDTEYLKKDLAKIFTLATLALLVQAGLFIGIHHGLKIPGFAS